MKIYNFIALVLLSSITIGMFAMEKEKPEWEKPKPNFGASTDKSSDTKQGKYIKTKKPTYQKMEQELNDQLEEDQEKQEKRNSWLSTREQDFERKQAMRRQREESERQKSSKKRKISDE